MGKFIKLSVMFIVSIILFSTLEVKFDSDSKDIKRKCRDYYNSLDWTVKLPEIK